MRCAKTILLACWILVATSGAVLSLPAGAHVGGNVAPDGTKLHNDIPGIWHLKNKAGRDGSGLCVFTAIDHAARWQGVTPLIGFRDWMTRRPGGGYPQKVDAMITAICREKGVPRPKYLQVEGVDLEILKKACASGRVPGVTYGYSPSGRYGGQRISHMVSLVHADEQNFCVLDNNYPGPTNYEWLTPREFLGAYRSTSGQGWAVILLSPGPPPYPKN